MPYNLLSLAAVTRPLRFEGRPLDEKYHVDTARYFAALALNHPKHNEFINRSTMNQDYRLNKQWKEGTNVQAFFKDDSNNATGRVKWTMNYIHRIAQKYVSDAMKMDFTFGCENISPNALKREEEEKQYMKFATEYANNSLGGFKDFIKSEMPIGNNPDQTEEMFDLSYSDKVAKDTTLLIDYARREYEYDKFKKQMAEDLCDSGLCVLKPTPHYGGYPAERISWFRMLLDRRARNYDFTDAEFMGDLLDYDSTTIYESYPNLSKEQKNTIERFCGTGSVRAQATTDVNGILGNTRMSIVKMYWRDIDESTWGWVYDEDNMPILKQINVKQEGEDEARYTDKDLVPVNKLNYYQKNLLGGSNKRKLILDVLRFCEFIPREIIGYREDKADDNGIFDIILNFGLADYCERDLYKPNSVKFPHKVSTWIYTDGEIDTPFSLLVDPQNLINRYESIREQKMRSLPIGSLIYDINAVTGKEGEDEAALLNSQATGKPFGIDARGIGVNLAANYVQPNYQGILGIFQVIDNIKFKMQEIMGVNDSFLASTQNSEQLVGVTSMQIQQATGLLYPFYDAISRVYEQFYNSIANVYRKILANDEHRLSIIMGNGKARELMFLKEHNIEDVRVFIERMPDKEQQIKAADGLIMGLLQAGLSTETASLLLGKSTKKEVTAAWHKDIRIAKLVQQQSQEQATQQAQAQLPMEIQGKIAEQNDTDRANKDAMTIANEKNKTALESASIKGTTELAKTHLNNQANQVQLPPPTQ